MVERLYHYCGVGVVTGTIIGLQLSLIWPTFMKMGGHVIALPLFMETFAFFFEAIFLSIYLYTWDRFKINGHTSLLVYQSSLVVHSPRSLLPL